jgi:hypothetical protein
VGLKMNRRGAVLLASLVLSAEGFQPAALVRGVAAPSWSLPGLSTCGVHGAVSMARESVGLARLRMDGSASNQQVRQASTRDLHIAVGSWARMKNAVLVIVAVVSVIPILPRFRSSLLVEAC